MMKKTFYYIAAAVLTLGLASCAKEAAQEHPINTDGARQISVWAQIDDEATTKTALSGNDAEGYTVLWSEGDEITVADGLNSTFTLVEGAGTSRGRFVGTSEAGDGTYGVFYAASVATNYKTLRSTSQYNGDKVISSAPMAATITVSNGEATITDFKNLCGLLRLTLRGSGTVKEIKIYASQALYGNFDILPDGSAVIPSSPYNDYITQTCENGVSLSSTGTDFYISLPPDDYSGVKIDVSDFAGHTFTKTLKAEKSLNIARAQITPVAFSVTGLTNDNVPLTWDSPVGTVGMLDGRECVVVDLGGNVGKMAIATKNVGASSPTANGTEMTWQNAVNQQNSEEWGLGWRLPSKEEIEALQNFQSRKTSNSFVLNIAEGVDLEFPLNGAGISSLSGKSVIWGSDLRFDSYGHLPCAMVDGFSYFNPNLNKTNKTSVRPVHRLPITRNTPVDAVGFIGGKEGVVYELNKVTGKTKVVIALTNAGANSVRYNYEDDKVRYNCYGTVTTYENISHFIHGGWYLPTSNDMEGLYRETRWGSNFNTNYIYKPGMKNEDTNMSLRPDDVYNLEFPCSGGVGFTETDINHGSYWTSTEDSDGGVFLMFVYIQSGRGGIALNYDKSYSKDSKAAARFFHAMP